MVSTEREICLVYDKNTCYCEFVTLHADIRDEATTPTGISFPFGREVGRNHANALPFGRCVKSRMFTNL